MAAWASSSSSSLANYSSSTSILPRTASKTSCPFNSHQHRPVTSVSLLPYHRPSTSSLSWAQKEVGIRIGWNIGEEKACLASALRTSAVRQLTGSLTSAEGLRFGIVVARFNEIVTKPLLEGALDTFKKYSVKEEDVDVVWVPGSFEIGVVAERLGRSKKYDAIVCIGAVVRGDTTHYDAVANSAASGVLSAGMNSGVPCIFGVLTCDNMDQPSFEGVGMAAHAALLALNRAGGKSGNKGAEAALTAIEMASLFEHHLKL